MKKKEAESTLPKKAPLDIFVPTEEFDKGEAEAHEFYADPQSLIDDYGGGDKDWLRVAVYKFAGYARVENKTIVTPEK